MKSLIVAGVAFAILGVRPTFAKEPSPDVAKVVEKEARLWAKVLMEGRVYTNKLDGEKKLAVPPGVTLDRYPLLPRGLNFDEAHGSRMWIRSHVQESLFVYRFDRKIKRFVVEYLPPRTWVLEELETGRPIYVVRTGERLSEIRSAGQ